MIILRLLRQSLTERQYLSESTLHLTPLSLLMTSQINLVIQIMSTSSKKFVLSASHFLLTKIITPIGRETYFTPTGRETYFTPIGREIFLFFGRKVKILLNYPRFSHLSESSASTEIQAGRKADLHFRPGSGSGYLVDYFSFLV